MFIEVYEPGNSCDPAYTVKMYVNGKIEAVKGKLLTEETILTEETTMEELLSTAGYLQNIVLKRRVPEGLKEDLHDTMKVIEAINVCKNCINSGYKELDKGVSPDGWLVYSLHVEEGSRGKLVDVELMNVLPYGGELEIKLYMNSVESKKFLKGGERVE